jgi:hypothetical protein
MINLTIPGQMSEGELRGLEQLARRAPRNGCIVEVGSLYGLSSWTWAKSADPSVTVHCIDPWRRDQWIIDLVETKIADCPPFGMDAFSRFVSDCPNIVAHQGFSPDDFRGWEQPIDIFFDDALHHNPFFRGSIRFWYSKMRPGGIMSGHDYCSTWPDVMNEVNSLAEEVDIVVHRRQWLWWIELPMSLPTLKRNGWKFG